MNLKYFDFIEGYWLDISGQPGAALEYNDDSGWVTTGGCKRYTAIVNQSGTDDPVVTVLENTLDPTIYMYRNEASAYIISSEAGAFIADKTFFNNEFYVPTSANSSDQKYITISRNDEYSLLIKTYRISTGTWTEEDDLLIDYKIDIRVYN